MAALSTLTRDVGGAGLKNGPLYQCGIAAEFRLPAERQEHREDAEFSVRG